jgi:hydroxymethylglutaryl-CoA lyase
MLQRMGIETGVSINALIETGVWLQEKIGRPIPGMLIKAGMFPRHDSDEAA